MYEYSQHGIKVRGFFAPQKVLISIATLGAQDSLVPFLDACPKNRRVLVFMSGLASRPPMHRPYRRMTERTALIRTSPRVSSPRDSYCSSPPITPLLSAAAAVLHDEHEHPLLVNSNQSLNNDQNALNVAVDDDDKINV
ncbi:hypothetical protein B0H13DRAFT_1894765 [Mycena leptocephala]|nr:hypothetical protein B0H13DRAFT_1894765 [Mycena leptocephala]